MVSLAAYKKYSYRPSREFDSKCVSVVAARVAVLRYGTAGVYPRALLDASLVDLRLRTEVRVDRLRSCAGRSSSRSAAIPVAATARVTEPSRLGGRAGLGWGGPSDAPP